MSTLVRPLRGVVGRGDDDAVEVLLFDEVVERVSVGASAGDARIDLYAL